MSLPCYQNYTPITLPFLNRDSCQQQLDSYSKIGDRLWMGIDGSLEVRPKTPVEVIGEMAMTVLLGAGQFLNFSVSSIPNNNSVLENPISQIFNFSKKNQIQSSLGEELQLCDRDPGHISKKDFIKYNTKLAFCYRFNRSDLEELRVGYKKLNFPKFIDHYAKQNHSCEVIQFQKKYPHTVSFIPNRTFFFAINPGHITKEHQDRLPDTKNLKNVKDGLALIGYYFHPNLIQKYFHNFNDTSSLNGPTFYVDLSVMNYKQVEEEHPDSYLVSILDLTKEHVVYLKEIKSHVDRLIKETYGVTSQDHIRYYFHFPYDPQTTSLHLHVKINSNSHGLEKLKIYHFEEIIHYLETNRSVVDLIVERASRQDGCLYTDIRHVLSEKCPSDSKLEDVSCYSSRLSEELNKLNPPVSPVVDIVLNPCFINSTKNGTP